MIRITADPALADHIVHLSPQQAHVLVFLAAWQAQFGCPSHRELAVALGVSPTRVAQVLERLRDRGVLWDVDGRNRAQRLTRKGRRAVEAMTEHVVMQVLT